MNPITFNALQAVQDENGQFRLETITNTLYDIPEGEVLIKVHYSSLNYKDALSASGNRAVTKVYPHVPGIDASGVIEVSNANDWHAGDKVIVTGFDFGMNTDGGFAEYVKVPAKWLVKLPQGLSLRQSMIYGTAGFTSGLSVAALIRSGITPDKGDIVVSGATGGVGSVAIAILSKLGYRVLAVSSKTSANSFLTNLGAYEVIPRAELEEQPGKILLKPRFAAGIDTVGGQVLASIIKSLDYGGVVTTCGMVNGGELPITVFPFILKGIQLIGIDSVELPLEHRLPVWEKLSGEWLPDNLDELAREISLNELPEHIKLILAGQMHGRVVVRMID